VGRPTNSFPAPPLLGFRREGLRFRVLFPGASSAWVEEGFKRNGGGLRRKRRGGVAGAGAGAGAGGKLIQGGERFIES